ncbi:MAG: BatD family protein [Prevotellaceae bacterium]|jgi:hypothetical protein|nr:BatD family protein [Prevotellaceae bacterium]
MKQKIIFLTILFISFAAFVKADDVQFTVQAPSTAVLDEPFQLVYTVNTRGKDIRIPEITDFEILAGPFERYSSNTQYINGQRSSSVSISYTYTLLAKRTGTFNIGPATITVDGTKYSSKGAVIKVLEPNQASQQRQNRQSQTAPSGSSAVSNDNIFIRTIASKTKVYEQEAILLTYKLYTLVDVVNFTEFKIPEFNGFMKQEIELPRNRQFAVENYNGRNYSTLILQQMLLFPQRSGEISIARADFEAVLRVQNRTQIRSIFDDFFDSYTTVSKSLTAPGVKITVESLPTNKPASYANAVGNFSLTSSISTNKVKTNEAVTLKLTISGSGNMKMIKTPALPLSSVFETYDPRSSDSFKTTASGVSGAKSIEYIFIPRQEGNFEIPSIEFSYFDPIEKRYKTLHTPSYQLEVEKGEAGSESAVIGSHYVGREAVKKLGEDIRYIHTDDVQPEKEAPLLFGTITAWLLFLCPFALSLILFFFFRKKAKENADIRNVKTKKANKIAGKRLKSAQKLLNDGQQDAFYDEVLKAVWSYLGDKLAITAAGLKKDKVETELKNKQVDESLINRFLDILNTCEFARYAPNTGRQEMGNLYHETVNAISELESALKR